MDCALLLIGCFSFSQFKEFSTPEGEKGLVIGGKEQILERIKVISGRENEA